MALWRHRCRRRRNSVYMGSGNGLSPVQHENLGQPWRFSGARFWKHSRRLNCVTWYQHSTPIIVTGHMPQYCILWIDISIGINGYSHQSQWCHRYITPLTYGWYTQITRFISESFILFHPYIGWAYFVTSELYTALGVSQEFMIYHINDPLLRH